MRTTLGGFLGKIPRPTPAMAVALLALLIAASGAAVAAGSFKASDGTITACRDNKSGVLRVIQSGQSCNASKETTITWKDGITGKVADSELLDGKDSTEFLGADQKAADADKLDGIDSTQLPHGFYDVKQIFIRASPENGFAAAIVLCDEGDKVVGGGYEALDETSWVATDAPLFDRGESETQSGWVIAWKTQDPSTTDDILVHALCADFGAPHP
jgi:hypothetical protein